MSEAVKNKENVVDDSGGVLTAEQKARISSKFRAAKALLARKRLLQHCPQLSLNKVGKAQKTTSLDQIDGDKRFPLTEIPMNAPPLICEKGSDKTFSGFTSIKGSQVSERNSSINGRTKYETQLQAVEPFKLYNNRSESVEAKLSENGKSAQVESMVGLDTYKTPVRQPEFSGLSESSFSSTVLDDDFYEHILDQIDALCEQNSKGKPELKRFNNVPIENNYINNLGKEDNLNPVVCSDSSGRECILMSTGNQESEAERSKSSKPDNSNLVSSDETFKLERFPNLTGNQEYEVEETKSSKATDTGSKLEATDIRKMPEDYSKYVESLNARQQEAACSDISIPLIIVAGPGSGKTSTMVGRVLMLLHKGIGPSNILAMTFTTAAASEMRERIGRVAGKTAAKELTISTFHSFSLQLCRMHADKLGRTPDFLIYGHGQQRRAAIEAVRLLDDKKSEPRDELCQLTDMNSPQYFKERSKKWLKFVTQVKSAGKTPDDYYKVGNETGAAVLQSYNDILKACNALDYRDLISCSAKLLTDFSEVFEECQELWKAMVIDEFQDRSAVQYELLRILASHKRITIVGDEDQVKLVFSYFIQWNIFLSFCCDNFFTSFFLSSTLLLRVFNIILPSIFGFNGADTSGFDSFRKDFPLNKEITIKECCNEAAQCSFVVDKILEISSDGTAGKSSFGDIAILFRRQVSEKIFQAAFRNRKIPFNVHGVAFYRKKVVRTIIAMLRTTLPGSDDGSFRRVFKALLLSEKEETKKVIEHIENVSTVRKSSFISAAGDIFSAKVSGTFKRFVQELLAVLFAVKLSMIYPFSSTGVNSLKGGRCCS